MRKCNIHDKKGRKGEMVKMEARKRHAAKEKAKGEAKGKGRRPSRK